MAKRKSQKRGKKVCVKMPEEMVETLRKRGGGHGHKKGKRLYSRKTKHKTSYKHTGLFYF